MKKKRGILHHRMETARWQFWGFVMDHFPRIYSWAHKHLPIDTLPF